jgi:hypothetical protein
MPLIMVTPPVREKQLVSFFLLVRFLMPLIARLFFRFCLRTKNKEKKRKYTHVLPAIRAVHFRSNTRTPIVLVYVQNRKNLQTG